MISKEMQQQDTIAKSCDQTDHIVTIKVPNLPRFLHSPAQKEKVVRNRNNEKHRFRYCNFTFCQPHTYTFAPQMRPYMLQYPSTTPTCL